MTAAVLCGAVVGTARGWPPPPPARAAEPVALTVPSTAGPALTEPPVTGEPTTGAPTAADPTTAVPTAGPSTTAPPTPGAPAPGDPVSGAPTTGAPTPEVPTPGAPTPEVPVTGEPTPEAPAVEVPEADLAQHGSAFLAAGRVTLTFTPQNFGPSDVPDATTRLDWSVPLADEQDLPQRCVRAGRSSVLCRTGGLVAGAPGEPVEVRVRLRGEPDEVTLRMDTPWSGGTRDANPDNHAHEVLVLDTGDVYAF
ncbi:hypothetical protein JNUCC64_20365 [Streptomyces sp. JNUCC 64]